MTDDTTHTLHRGSVIALPLPVIVRASSGDKRVERRLERGKMTIGSGSTCDLVVDDPTMSRTHAELELVPEGVQLRDLQSRNGTYYLGQRIDSAVLSPGTRVSLGSSIVSIDLDATHLAQASSQRAGSFRGMLGASPSMLALFTLLGRLDGSLVPCLIRGESGVGKELVARAIHEGSRVASGPFVPINCGAIPREMVASTLFGHRRGAFTGAVENRRGAFGAADGGTLFLDEIGELPLDVQPALLRTLESGEVTAVGEDVPRKVHVRIVAATHRELDELVREGRFRQDVYYRIAVVTIGVAPLRERPEDIPELARFFARQEGAADLDAEMLAELSTRAFPGNVRELRNAVQTYVALGTLDTAPRSSVAPGPPLAEAPRLDVPYLAQRDALVASFTRAYVAALLDKTGGNQSEAARIAGLDRTYLGRLIAKLGVERRR